MTINSTMEPSAKAHRLLADYTAISDQIAGDVGALFGSDSSAAEAVQDLCRSHAAHWKGLCENRGLAIPVLAFIGPVGAGKTSLINLLLNRAESNLPTGESSGEKLQWIGSVPPAGMEPAVEQFHRVSPDELPTLGQPYLILDTPGFGKSTRRLKEVTQRAFASTRFKILVLESKKLEATHWQEEVAHGDGSVILPVIHLSSDITKKHKEAPIPVEKRLREEVSRSLKQHMRTATLLEPVILPDFEATGNQEKAERVSRTLLISALRLMLDTNGAGLLDRSRELEVSWPVFVSALRGVIDPLITERVREKHAVLDQVLKSMPRLVINEMLEDDRGLTALIRLDLRASLMDRIPGWAVPFRASAGLLCLTTGVWDRLVLGMAGSLPSTLITLYGAVKGRKEERNAEESHRAKVDGTIERIVRGHVYEPLGNFKAALAKHEADGAPDSEKRCNFQIHGIAPLAASWQYELKEATRMDPRKGRGWLITASLLATIVFWLLISGPLVHSYGQYIPAVFRSLSGAWDDGQLRTYPAMGGGFWLTALILSIIPVFIMAMLVVSKSLSRAKTSACLLKFRTKMEDEIKNGAIVLDVEMHDSKINAYQRLLTCVQAKLL
jgi:hypothetical protein